jgi:hypothetical protein
MKRLVSAVLMLTLILLVVPVQAGDTFHALSHLPATSQASLTPMDEAQLAAIEGGQREVTQSNIVIVTVTQSNSISITGSGDVSVIQSNSSSVNITQQNSVNGR